MFVPFKNYPIAQLRAWPRIPFRLLTCQGVHGNGQLADWSHVTLQGNTDRRLPEYTQGPKGTVQVGVAKPGVIVDPKVDALIKVGRMALRSIMGFYKVSLGTIAAALPNQAISSFEKDMLQNRDLVRIGTNALAATPEQGQADFGYG